jgi:LuxR family transcriptional regulator, maltose regulon positive regulatory protein
MWPWALQLKTTPPSLSANSLVRRRLSFERFAGAGSNIIEVSAPQGFGKTHLLAQWHAEAREQGKAIIWLSLDSQYDARRFVQGLAAASTRREQAVLDEAFATWVRDADDTMAALTGWIVEIAQSGKDCLLILDDADLVSQQLQEGEVAFTLANAPGNLKVVLSTRPGNPIFQQAPLFCCPLIRITAQELRFTEDEAFAVTARSLQGRASAALCAHLHRLTDGWPLGLQLVLSSQVGKDFAKPPEEVVSMALGKYFTEAILNHQTPPVREMLEALAFLDPIHPELVAAVIGPDAPLADLERLADTTPLIIRSQTDRWMTLHPAARKLLAGFHRLWPPARRAACARAAATWYTRNGLHEEAAQEARRAGDDDVALDLVEMAVREMTTEGRPSDVIGWIERLSPADLRTRPTFWLPAAWAYANANRPDKVQPLLDLLCTKSDMTRTERFEVALIEVAIAGYRDDYATLAAFAQDWPESPPDSLQSERLLHALVLATERHLSGRPVEARAIIAATVAERGGRESSGIVHAYADYYIALSFLWEGKPAMAYDVLKPVMERLLSEVDRRSFAVSLIAAVLAEAAVEIMKIDEARSIIGGRLAMIEKLPSPDALIAGHLASARLAEAEGRFDLAESLLAALVSTGKTRQLPRVEAVGLSMLARFHARHGHSSLARAASLRLDTLEALLPPDSPVQIRSIISLQANLARAVLPERSGETPMVDAAARAVRLAQELGRGSDQLLASALHGVALVQAGEAAGQAEFEEAAATAKGWGLLRLHADLMALNRSGQRELAPKASAPSVLPTPAGGEGNIGILTRREYDILCGIAAHLSNKEIALSLGLSNETVKWHLKNLFQKLDAGERKIAVARARMLGIL